MRLHELDAELVSGSSIRRKGWGSVYSVRLESVTGKLVYASPPSEACDIFTPRYMDAIADDWELVRDPVDEAWEKISDQEDFITISLSSLDRHDYAEHWFRRGYSAAMEAK